MTVSNFVRLSYKYTIRTSTKQWILNWTVLMSPLRWICYRDRDTQIAEDASSKQLNNSFFFILFTQNMDLKMTLNMCHSVCIGSVCLEIVAAAHHSCSHLMLSKMSTFTISSLLSANAFYTQLQGLLFRWQCRSALYLLYHFVAITF